MTGRSFKQLLEAAERRPEYWEEGAILDFTEALYDAMQCQGVTRAELARRLGTSQAYITRVLSGNANFTLRTMSKLAHALGMRLDVGLSPQKRAASAAEAGERRT
jgi:transcriptional regulator with XRE-family HTH domain